MLSTAIITRTNAGRILACSDALARLCGYEPHELVGRAIDELLRSVDPAASPALGTATLLRKGGPPLEVVWHRAPLIDGHKQVAVVAELISFEPSEPAADAVALHDVPAERASSFREAPALEAQLGHERFRWLVERLPLLTWTADPQGSIDYLSPGWCQYSGEQREQLYGWSFIDVVHPEDRERMVATWRSTLASGTDSSVEVRIRRYDGAFRWFLGCARPVRNADGRIVKWLGYNVDVHEERTAQEALRRERDRLERIIAMAPGHYFSVRLHADGRMTMPEVSAGLEALLGMPAAALAVDAEPAVARVHEADVGRAVELRQESERTLSPWHSEHRMHVSGGGLRWIEHYAAPTREADGSTLWTGFARDITERKRAEQALRTVQWQLAGAFEAGRMGYWSWDIDRDELRLDPSLLKLLGHDGDETRGTSADLLRFVHLDDHPLVDAVFAEMRATREIRPFEYRVHTRSGELCWLSASGCCQPSEETQTTVATVFHIDITEQKRAAEAQARSQKLEALGTLAGGIAHEFNNMLQAIVGNAGLARAALSPDQPARRHIEGIATAAARAGDLVRQILAFSRPGEQHSEVVSLSEVVEDALRLMRATLPAHIEIATELGADALRVEAGTTQIHQVVLNVATNAAHAIGSSRGLIRIRLERVQIAPGGATPSVALEPGTYARMEVSDTGRGMSAETLERIFDPFFTTKPIGEGSGLGLSVVHGIVTSLGGAVSARSQPGAGTTFSIYLPITTRSASPSSIPPVGTVDGAGRRVLFIDDEDLLVDLGTHMLAALGYRPEGYASPEEALRAFTADPASFDLVVTDLSMPKISGFDLAKRLLEQRPELPIVMMSGNVRPSDKAQAARLGIKYVLPKPVGLEDLGRTLAKALYERGGKPARR